MNRKESFLDMDSKWRSGIWIPQGKQNGEKPFQINEAVPTSRLLNIAFYMINPVVQHLHCTYYDYLALNNVDKCMELLRLYENHFPEIVLVELKRHPVWSTIEDQLYDRNLYDYYVNKIK